MHRFVIITHQFENKAVSKTTCNEYDNNVQTIHRKYPCIEGIVRMNVLSFLFTKWLLNIPELKIFHGLHDASRSISTYQTTCY